MRCLLIQCLVYSIAAVALLAARVQGAPPDVASFHPTGIQRGQTAEIVATGSFSAWPAAVWTEFPGLVIEPAADKGKLKITASADAPLGIHWIRLTDGEGASTPRPFFVGTLPEMVETEPNHDIGEAQAIAAGTVISGKLQRRGDVDIFAVTLQAGQTLVADLIASEVLGSPMDAVLQLCAADGTVLQQQHDTRGLDPRVVFECRDAGTYLIRLFSFPSQPDSSINFAGGENYAYRLTVTTGPFADHALPLAVSSGAANELTLGGWNIPSSVTKLEVGADAWREQWLWQPPDAGGLIPLRLVGHPLLTASPSASRQSPQAVQVPVTIGGRLDAPREVDVFSLTAAKGKRLEINVESASLGYDLDPVVEVFDSGDKLLAENDDGQRNERDSKLSFMPQADGEYRIHVRDLHSRGGTRMVYRCTIAEPAPDYSLSLAGGSFVIVPGMTAEVAVTVNRLSGFKGEIEIAALELPPGVTAEPVRSPAEGDASKSVKLVLQATADAKSGAVRIRGQAADSSLGPRWGTFESSQGGAKFAHRDVWLAVGKAK